MPGLEVQSNLGLSLQGSAATATILKLRPRHLELPQLDL
jgi:hypothetical protein